jgi:hypothetical protein
VNMLDVNLAISQVVGSATCGSAGLQQTGTCTIIDVQRIVYASLGNACKVGN